MPHARSILTIFEIVKSHFLSGVVTQFEKFEVGFNSLGFGCPRDSLLDCQILIMISGI
jgi:hypothetical protein